MMVQLSLLPMVVIRLQQAPEFLEESLRAKELTLSRMAHLVNEAKAVGREIAPFGIPAKDIFDLLDEQVIHDEYPKFPGHREANSSWEADTQGLGRKEYYQLLYEMPQGVESLYVPIADRMRRRNLLPPALVDVFEDIVRYALVD
jgi:hypothetical protein